MFVGGSATESRLLGNQVMPVAVAEPQGEKPLKVWRTSPETSFKDEFLCLTLGTLSIMVFSHGLGLLPSIFSYQVDSFSFCAFSASLFVFHHHPLTTPVQKPPR